MSEFKLRQKSHFWFGFSHMNLIYHDELVCAKLAGKRLLSHGDENFLFKLPQLYKILVSINS